MCTANAVTDASNIATALPFLVRFILVVFGDGFSLAQHEGIGRCCCFRWDSGFFSMAILLLCTVAQIVAALWDWPGSPLLPKTDSWKIDSFYKSEGLFFQPQRGQRMSKILPPKGGEIGQISFG